MKHSLEASNAHETGNLSSCDADSGSSHEAADGRKRDKLYEPPLTKETDAQYDEASDEGNCCCDGRAVELVGMLRIDVLDDFRYRKRHDSDWTDGDIFRCGE